MAGNAPRTPAPVVSHDTNLDDDKKRSKNIKTKQRKKDAKDGNRGGHKVPQSIGQKGGRQIFTAPYDPTLTLDYKRKWGCGPPRQSGKPRGDWNPPIPSKRTDRSVVCGRCTESHYAYSCPYDSDEACRRSKLISHREGMPSMNTRHLVYDDDNNDCSVGTSGRELI